MSRTRMCAALAAAVSATLLTATAAHADRDVAVSIGLEGMGGLHIQMSQGQPTNCTRDEQYGIEVINPDQTQLQFRMVAKNGGSCAVEDSVNTWHLEMPGGSGNVVVNGWSGVYGYHANCGGDWTGPYECVWGFHQSTIRRRADGLPASEHPCTIVGTAGDDVICGRGGDDVIDGRGGDDIIRGGPGRDRLAGGAGDDSITGGPGHDLVVKDGHDSVAQGPGDEDTAKQLLGDHRETGTLWFHDMEGRRSRRRRASRRTAPRTSSTTRSRHRTPTTSTPTERRSRATAGAPSSPATTSGTSRCPAAAPAASR